MNAEIPPTPPGTQTIVIERRERTGLLKRLFQVGLFLLVLMLLFGGLMSRESGFPTRLAERYVAGELTGPKVAVVAVEGAIGDESAEHAIRQLRQARADDLVKAVVLRVDSPGGTVTGSDRIWREVQVLKASGKPVVASFGGVAASGGYYVAAPADHIVTEPTTMTGSIGVIFELPQVEELLDKVGVSFETITTGEWKDSGSMFRKMTPEERERWRQMIDHSYQRFVRIVAQGRNLPLEATKALANGKVYTADEALKLKLVDQLGYLDDAVLEAQRRAKLESAHVVRYAKPFTFTDALTGLSGGARGLDLDLGKALGAETMMNLRTPRMLFLAR
jgi:protease-4